MNVFSRNSVALLSDLGGIEIRNWETEDFSSVPGLDSSKNPSGLGYQAKSHLGCSAWCQKNIFVVTKVNFSPHHNRVSDQLTKSECGIYINL
jgi:hypothetical protein